MELTPDIVLEVDDLRTYFDVGSRVAKSVDGVTFAVRRGETVAIVGESGSGKSVTSLSIMRLLSPPGRIAGGRIRYRTGDGRVLDIADLPDRAMRDIRGREIAMIFQEPMTSLNPLFTVGDQIVEMIRLHQPASRAEARRQARRMLDLVEIPAAERRLDDYPHQMSGGMRQRVMIALALACDPKLLIADEPTTALDATIQAQILDLIRRLQGELGMSVLFITHNLGVVAEIAHQVVVMYAGRVVETASVEALFAHQKHPYTRGLLACIPNAARDRDASGERLRLKPIAGQVPSVLALPPGCNFAPCCAWRVERCAEEPPLLAAGPAHHSRCWRHADL
jgi:peptide/nickel transport system ATP-binding protein